MSAVWKYLKLYEKELYKTHYKHVTQTARLFALQLMSPMRRGRVDDEWIARIACNAIQQHYTSSLHQGSKSKAQEKSVTRQLLSNIFIRFFIGMCQCDTCDKHLPKLVRIIYKKKHSGPIAGFCQNKSSINIHKC